MGRSRLKEGERLANLSVVAEDPATAWTPITVAEWYGGKERTIEVASATAVWYSTGLPAVPLRWVLIRDPTKGEFDTQALFLCTDLNAEPGKKIVCWFVRRWQMEATFQEVRQRLGGSKPRGIGPSGRSKGLLPHCWDCSRWLRCSPTAKGNGSRKPCGGRRGTTKRTRPSPMP